MVREIGGYLELERFAGEPFHPDAIALNSGRGCLAYLIELRHIGTVWLPDFMCDSVYGLFEREGVHVRRYPINASLLPDYPSFDMKDGDWLLLMDYYGQLQPGEVDRASEVSCGNLIVDETQGFFRKPWGNADTTYTCRKWFGVPDGAYLCTKDGVRLPRDLERDESFNRMGFVVGRFERTASEFYDLASANNALFSQEPAKAMSSLTENLLNAVDYSQVLMRRRRNWAHLAQRLEVSNLLGLSEPWGPFMYPYKVDDAGDVRSRLAREGVFVPMLWPNVAVDDGVGPVAHDCASNILPLPIDQRYDLEDMEVLVEVLLRCLN